MTLCAASSCSVQESTFLPALTVNPPPTHSVTNILVVADLQAPQESDPYYAANALQAFIADFQDAISSTKRCRKREPGRLSQCADCQP